MNRVIKIFKTMIEISNSNNNEILNAKIKAVAVLIRKFLFKVPYARGTSSQIRTPIDISPVEERFVFPN